MYFFLNFPKIFWYDFLIGILLISLISFLFLYIILDSLLPFELKYVEKDWYFEDAFLFLFSLDENSNKWISKCLNDFNFGFSLENIFISFLSKYDWALFFGGLFFLILFFSFSLSLSFLIIVIWDLFIEFFEENFIGFIFEVLILFFVKVKRGFNNFLFTKFEYGAFK